MTTPTNVSTCRCDLCEKYRQGKDRQNSWSCIKCVEHTVIGNTTCETCNDGSNFESIEDQDTIKKNDHETDYTSDSLVSKHNKRINELVEAHWKYQEKLLSVGQDKSQKFTWERVMEMRKWDYCSSAKHFYGHGYEDAIDYCEK